MGKISGIKNITFKEYRKEVKELVGFNNRFIAYILFLVVKIINNKNFCVFLLIVSVINFLWLVIPYKEYPLQNDAIEYWDFARAINHFQYSSFSPNTTNPTYVIKFGYHIFVASVMFLFGERQFPIYFVQYLLYCISFIFLYRLSYKIIKSEKYALFTCIFYALCPAPIVYYRCFLTESLSLFLIIIALDLFFEYYFYSRKSALFFSALIFVWLVLIRITFFGIPLILALFLLPKRDSWFPLVSITQGASGKTSLKNTLIFLSLFLSLSLISLTILSKGTIFNEILTTFTHTNLNLAPTELYKQPLHIKLFWLWGVPVIRQSIYTQIYSYSPLFKFPFPALLFIFYSVPFSILLFKPVPKPLLILYSILLYWTLAYLLSFSIPRFQIPCIPIIILIFASSLNQLLLLRNSLSSHTKN